MINRVLIASLVFAAPARPVSAQDAKISVNMIGIGRAYDLRPLAVYASASIGGDHLDLRFLDGTQLCCCSE
jgi:hypothetical protein